MQRDEGFWVSEQAYYDHMCGLVACPLFGMGSCENPTQGVHTSADSPQDWLDRLADFPLV